MDAAGLIDDRNCIIHLNAAAARLWGRDEAEVKGRGVGILLSADLREQQEALINRHRRTQKPLAAGMPCEVQGERKDGRRLCCSVAVAAARGGLHALLPRQVSVVSDEIDGRLEHG